MEYLSGITALVSAVCGNALVVYLIQRHFNRKDKEREAERKRLTQKQQEQIERWEAATQQVHTGLETIRLLAYARTSHEIERLLTQGYATPAERSYLGELSSNYKKHGWNGDMDSRLQKVYDLRTSPPGRKEE